MIEKEGYDGGWEVERYERAYRPVTTDAFSPDGSTLECKHLQVNCTFPPTVYR